jgi:hypothetical protein
METVPYLFKMVVLIYKERERERSLSRDAQLKLVVARKLTRVIISI